MGATRGRARRVATARSRAERRPVPARPGLAIAARVEVVNGRGVSVSLEATRGRTTAGALRLQRLWAASMPVAPADRRRSPIRVRRRARTIGVCVAALALACGDGPDARDGATVGTGTDAPGMNEADTVAVVDTGPAIDTGPADVVRAYYEAIAAGDHAAAHAMWGDEGRASGLTLEEFRAGFARTDTVFVEPGPPGRVEGAAGSRYVELPVTVQARTIDGRRQCFRGRYVLRRSVVDGATPAQRRWHLYAANIVPCDRNESRARTVAPA